MAAASTDGAVASANRQLHRDRRSRAGGAPSFGSWTWTLPALTFVLLIHYAATIAGGVFAFTDWSGLGSWNWVGFDNFGKMAAEGALGGALAHTVMITVAFAVITNLAGLGFAIALNRTLKTRYLLRVLLFAPVVLSSLAVSYVFRFIFSQNGPLNQALTDLGLGNLTQTWLGDPFWALLAIVFVLVWQQIGLTMVIYLAALTGVQIEQEEAAALDGAGSFQRFRYVVLPTIRPAIGVASTLTLVTGLRVFDQVMAMTGGGPFGSTDTLATVIYRETFAYSKFGYGAALALAMFVFVLIAALLQFRFTQERG